MSKIGCFKRSELPMEFLPHHGCLKMDFLSLEKKLPTLSFFRKEAVEYDENFKQPIPYVVLKNKLGHVGFYQRNGSENRLKGIWSVGFGGHVDESDQSKEGTLFKTFINCAKRELNEELSLTLLHDLKFLGIINEELTKVGRTHLGFVFLYELFDDDTIVKSDEIKDLKFIDNKFSNQYQLELWSTLVIKLLLP